MAGKSKITIATLTKLGAPKLAALLLAEAAGNKQLKQAIELAISAKKGPEILAANVRKRLASLAKSRSLPSYERGRELIAELGRYVDDAQSNIGVQKDLEDPPGQGA